MKAGYVETERLILRGITRQDADLIVKWRADPEVYKFFRLPHRLTMEEHLKWYRERYLTDRQHCIWMAVRKEDEVPVGMFGLRKSGKEEAEISYLIAPRMQGNGYAQETAVSLLSWAKKEWNIRTVFAEIHYENGPSVRFVRRLGFEEAGKNKNFRVYKKTM